MSGVELLIADGRVHVHPGETVEGWLAIDDGRVAAVGDGPAPAARTVLDARGRDVIPGAIDTHVHFRDPGEEAKEEFSTGSLAAAFGGVTTVADMPNTGRLVVSPDDVRAKRDHIAGRSWVDFGLHANLNDSSAFVGELAELGVASLKWLMGYAEWEGIRSQPSDNVELRETLRAAARAGMVVQVHAEALPWVTDLRRSLRATGRTDPAVHDDSRPSFVEAIAIAEAALLAADTGCRMHIVHVTGRRPLQTAVAMREALGIDLTLETCPQYLHLTGDDLAHLGPFAQANPPIRAADDRDALWEALGDGTIFSVATDHAPHLPADKQGDNPLDVASGIIGVETMVPLLLDAVAAGRLTLARVVELLCANPARLLGVADRKGALAPGCDGDVAIVDLAAEWTIAGARLHSKQRTTPYEGRTLRGAVDTVLLRGRPLIVDRQLVADAPSGRYTPSRHLVASNA